MPTRMPTDVNGKPHSETRRAPADALAAERDHLHVLPREPYTAALGETRSVDDDQSYLELLRVLSEALDERKLRFDLAGGVKNIQAWNRRPELGGRLPYVLLVIDELAELSVEEAADAEEKRRRQEALALLSRMARLGRALGFHIIAATQRPAVDTVPGPIKSQLLARCCFKVASGTESRVVLGEDNSAGADLPAHPGSRDTRTTSGRSARRCRRPIAAPSRPSKLATWSRCIATRIAQAVR